ncbi:MAG: hypothetical protein NC324_10030 [Bacteroides sp.]|nr:hypothetical protein [Bacteroides sp.]
MLKFILTLLFNLFAGALVAGIAGFSARAGALMGLGLGFLMPAVPGLRAGVFREVWTGETIKAFRNSVESIGWLNKLVNKSKYVLNNVIHFVDLGGDPDVLVNNTSYPLEVQTLEDGDKAVTLDKYQTKPTVITDDELYASSYDRMASVIERHREKVNETKIARALHSLAPSENKDLTPVLATSGEVTADGRRKKLTRKDIIALKGSFDVQKVPTAGRILVLCPDHVNDLLESDQKFADQYYNYTSGKIANLYGFEVYEYVDCPLFDAATLKKKAYGAVAGESDFTASVAFHAGNCIRMEGETKAYLSEAKTDPKNQCSLYGVKHYFMALPLKERAMGAIVSAKAE